jgi:cell division protein FtsL
MPPFENLKRSMRTMLSNNSDNNQPPPKKQTTQRSISYRYRGLARAEAHKGSREGLITSLAQIREEYRKMLGEDIEKQKELKKPYIIEKDTLEAENKEDGKRINEIEDKTIPEIEQEIKPIKRDIERLRKNPPDPHKDSANKLGFIIGVFIISVLTVYLFIFYSSASYSAFFKEFTTNSLGMAKAIFDSQALAKAYYDGTAELILILCMPIIFIGLGFLLHQFQKNDSPKKYIQTIGVTVVTFMFDAILAYMIDKKIYDVNNKINEINAENSFATPDNVQSVADFSVSMALQSVNFWMIIFAGFVVYMIWGMLFDYVMDAYDKLDEVRQKINSLKRQIVDLRKDITEQKNRRDLLKENVSKNKVRIKKLMSIINGIVIDTSRYDSILHEFLGGWIEWMSNNPCSELEIEEASKKGNEFITKNVREYILGPS